MLKENVKQLNLQVAEGISVNLLPNVAFEFLMTTQEVANGYGVTEYAIRKNKLSLSSELIEGKHFVTAKNFAVTNGNGVAVTDGNSEIKIPHNAILWTKRGVIRLGFAMRSERAKLFRDWAEELIIQIDEQRDLFGAVVPQKALPQKRKHNRITPARMVEILADVAKIEDKDLRLSLISKLGV
ncbi:hypothetical protein [Capnocytophaga canis]|uniref:hypothetical protein n=1 Tax=Capnocytophaga canis TaxID=1848903 RepID=UPI0037D3458D